CRRNSRQASSWPRSRPGRGISSARTRLWVSRSELQIRWSGARSFFVLPCFREKIVVALPLHIAGQLRPPREPELDLAPSASTAGNELRRRGGRKPEGSNSPATRVGLAKR